VKLSDFDYELPPALVAQAPAHRRDAARLFVHSIARDASEHREVRELPELLRPADLLVLNDTRVRRARLHARRASGGRVELLLLEPEVGGGAWRALVRPSARLRAGEDLALAPGAPRVRLLERLELAGAPSAQWRVELHAEGGAPVDVEAELERHGELPLPPYIERAFGADPRAQADRERYQTVYARKLGAVAAPTAGLHFTPELLAALAARGIASATLTLHVGLGTFQPVQVEDVREHPMHAERYELPQATVDAIAACRARAGRVVAVGTTSCRVLESCAAADGSLCSGHGSTRLYLLPGSPLRVVDALLTNFHLPRSTLLMLVSALAGRERVLRLYREAIERGYRFYSYGDAMLLHERP
jgi:S-adenosylmethionine:tRNA ribosyltransferase-isomerase